MGASIQQTMEGIYDSDNTIQKSQPEMDITEMQKTRADFNP